MKQQGALDRLMHYDEGFKFLKALRGSPPYFEKAKKDLFAMIRQLGPTTLFCSFSSAETQWIHLLQILGELVDRTRSDFEKHFTIKTCDKTFLKIISRLKKLLKSDDVSTLAERHYQVKISSDFWSINTKKKNNNS